jgi:hypothetical protein
VTSNHLLLDAGNEPDPCAGEGRVGRQGTGASEKSGRKME